MTRNELVEMIRQEIRSLAYETLRGNSQKEKEEKSKIFKPKGLSEEELEYAIFNGGEKPNKNDGLPMPTTIREGYDNGIPKINSSEIREFEDSFENMLKEVDGASVVFDTQSNGYSLKMSIGPDGIEAGASGVIDLGRSGKINWAYSLKNGLSVSMEDFFVDKGNKYILEQLYNHYDSWQKEWREKLTIQPGQDNEEPEAAPEAGTEAPAAAPDMGAAAPEGEPAP